MRPCNGMLRARAAPARSDPVDFAEFFGDNLRAAPEPEQFETFEVWTWRLVSEERRAIERIIAESVRESAAKPAALEIPAMPDGVPVNASIIEAWRTFHSVPRLPRESAPVAKRPHRRPGVRELHTFVADQNLDHLEP